MERMRKGLFSILAFLILTSLLYSPQFLAYGDYARKADAVILFLGRDDGAREKEAMALLKNDFADYLLIPARLEAFRYRGGDLQRILLRSSQRIRHSDINTQGFVLLNPERYQKTFIRLPSGGYRGRWENTHVEVFRARRMMEDFGMRSALMVSSPIHMRRIKVISSQLFNLPHDRLTGESFLLSFVSTRYERCPGFLWFLTPSDLQAVSLEYAKIAWFEIYNLFCASR